MKPFENLLIDEIPALRRYARALCQDFSQADDLLQECLARAVSKRRLWIRGRKLRPWLFTMMHNLFVNDLRRSDAMRATGDADVESFAVASEQDADLLCTMSDFERALQELSAEQREVLLLVGVEQMSYRQVAKMTGTPVGTVMSRLARGRERLASSLEGEIKLKNIKRVK